MPSRSRLARLLQFTCGLQLGVAGAWLAWWWTASVALALAGALLVLGIAPLILGIELLMVARVARGDASTPVPRPVQLARAWISESVHWYRTFCWRQPFRWRAEKDMLATDLPGRRGVVLVHGFMCNRGFWTPWIRRLRAAGHPCLAINLEPIFTAIDDYVPLVDAAVARMHAATGEAPVIVCHSMGGLAVRAWWRARGQADRAARLITIGSPHGGTWLARFSRRPNGRQMRLQSSWLRQLEADERLHPLPPTTCWYSNCDNVVFPPSTATLRQADNRFVPGQAHVALAFHPTVVEGSLALIAEVRRRQGESVTESRVEIG